MTSPAAEPARARRRGLTILKALALVVVMLLASELFMRWIDKKLPQSVANDQAEVELKWDQITELARTHQRTDIVFFGSSPMDSAIDPAIWAQNSKKYPLAYNAALLGQPYDSMNTWADKFVLTEMHPDVVVIGITPFDLPTFDVAGESRQVIDASFQGAYAKLRPGVLDRIGNDLSKHSALIRDRAAFHSPAELYDAVVDRLFHRKTPPRLPFQPVTLPNKQVALRTPAVWKKYLLKPRGGDANFYGVTYNPQQSSLTLSKTDQTLFRESFTSESQMSTLIDTARAHGAKKVILVVPPMISNAYVPLVGDKAYALSVIHSLGVEAKALGVPMIDFSQSDWPDSDFADSVHLNQNGSVRFSRELAAYLDSL